MNMTKKTRIDDDLEGFEEVMDLIDGVPRKKKSKKNGAGGNNKRLRDNFEVLNLLESEEDRLKKLGNLFYEKINNLRNFSQTDRLIEEQTRNRQIIHEKILESMREVNSNYQINIENFFDKNF